MKKNAFALCLIALGGLVSEASANLDTVACARQASRLSGCQVALWTTAGGYFPTYHADQLYELYPKFGDPRATLLLPIRWILDSIKLRKLHSIEADDEAAIRILANSFHARPRPELEFKVPDRRAATIELLQRLVREGAALCDAAVGLEEVAVFKPVPRERDDPYGLAPCYGLN